MNKRVSYPPMIFADIELALKIEAAECRLLCDAVNSIASRRAADVISIPIAGGIAAHVGCESPLNKVAGLGFHGPIPEDALTTIETRWHERKTPVQIELATLADPAVAAMLTQRGYILRGCENILGFNLQPTHNSLPAPHPLPALTSSHITVRQSTPDEQHAWLNTIVDGFCTPDTQGLPSHDWYPREALERAISDFAFAPGIIRHVAIINDQIVGGSSMKINGAIAQLSGAATLPNFRRRGVQTALLHARLQYAAQHHCTLAVMLALPGSKSHQNAQRHGFQLLYSRLILLREIA